VTQNCNKCKSNFRIIDRLHLFFRRNCFKSNFKIENEQIPAYNLPRNFFSKNHPLLVENLWKISIWIWGSVGSAEWNSTQWSQPPSSRSIWGRKFENGCKKCCLARPMKLLIVNTSIGYEWKSNFVHLGFQFPFFSNHLVCLHH
jgi:hypothetical protein